jgi:hypothetical protein
MSLFSFTPTAEEIEQRWITLLYGQKDTSFSESDKTIPWNEAEEVVLLREGESVSFSGFQSILEQHPTIFHASRSARNLEAHYFHLKRNSVATKMNPPTVLKKESASSDCAINPSPNLANSAASTSQTNNTLAPTTTSVNPKNSNTINGGKQHALSPRATTDANAPTGDPMATHSPPSTPHDDVPGSPLLPDTLEAAHQLAISIAMHDEQLAEQLRLEPDLAAPPPDLAVVAHCINGEPLPHGDAETDQLSPMQQSHRNREYMRIEKLTQREILKVEKEYARDRDSLRERDTKMLATIRGRKVRYCVRTKEVVIGRGSILDPVDISLMEEGPKEPNKCSRRHAIVKMKRDGEFYIKNIGKLALYINNKEVVPSKKRHLRDSCIIRIADIHFIFEVNKGAINKIKRQLQV